MKRSSPKVGNALSVNFCCAFLPIEMKITLYHLLSVHGDVVEISVKQSLNLRGQAFATFREQDMADRALKELTGFNLFGKQMVCDITPS